MNEQWRAIEEFPQYEVSDRGAVRRSESGYLMSLPLRKGYPVVGLRSGPRCRVVDVHRLVALAFLGPATGPLVRHLNGTPTDNRVENLAWGDAAANARDMIRHGRSAQRNQTHCRHGHAYETANTYLRPDGTRDCRACIRRRVAAYRVRKTAIITGVGEVTA